ncbi:MAG: hypothetical protein GDA38_17350 [Hormoscilla sp. SP12CHS1]|nr:hypothetical protein [Hormoscilla sp. SP12CHS1]
MHVGDEDDSRSSYRYQITAKRLPDRLLDRMGRKHGLFDIFIVTETSRDAVPLQPVFSFT